MLSRLSLAVLAATALPLGAACNAVDLDHSSAAVNEQGQASPCAALSAAYNQALAATGSYARTSDFELKLSSECAFVSAKQRGAVVNEERAVLPPEDESCRPVAEELTRALFLIAFPDKTFVDEIPAGVPVTDQTLIDESLTEVENDDNTIHEISVEFEADGRRRGTVYVVATEKESCRVLSVEQVGSVQPGVVIDF